MVDMWEPNKAKYIKGIKQINLHITSFCLDHQSDKQNVEHNLCSNIAYFADIGDHKVYYYSLVFISHSFRLTSPVLNRPICFFLLIGRD